MYTQDIEGATHHCCIANMRRFLRGHPGFFSMVLGSQNPNISCTLGNMKYSYTCMHVYTHTVTHAHTHIRMHTHTRTCTHTHACIHAHAHTHMHAHARTHTHMHTHTHTHTRTHTNTHTHKHAHTFPSCTIIILCLFQHTQRHGIIATVNLDKKVANSTISLPELLI